MENVNSFLKRFQPIDFSVISTALNRKFRYVNIGYEHFLMNQRDFEVGWNLLFTRSIFCHYYSKIYLVCKIFSHMLFFKIY